MLTTDLGRIVAQVDSLQAERDILHTLYRYCLALDHYSASDYVDCFSEDGAFEVLREDGTSARRIVGREALTTYITNMARSTGPVLKHLYTNPRVSVDGDSASAEGYGVALASVNGAAELRSFGSYRERMVRSADGVWRIKEKVYRFEGTGASHRTTGS